MSAFVLAGIYALVIWLIPPPEEREIPKYWRWTPHALAEEARGGTMIALHAWIVGFLLAMSCGFFLPNDQRDIVHTVLTAGTFLLICHCLWDRRQRIPLERGVEGFHFTVPPKHPALILIGPESALIELASASALLRADMKDIGIEGVRLCYTRNLPDKIPPEILMHITMPDLVEALVELNETHSSASRAQADRILELSNERTRLEERTFAQDATVSALEERIRRLEVALNTARQSSGSPFARTFKTNEAEVQALIDRLRTLIPQSSAKDLAEFEVQLQSDIAQTRS